MTLSATRSELIARRLQIGLATQGRDLLKEKRAALVVEFGHLSIGVLEAVETLGRRAAESATALSDAVGFDGSDAVGSASMAASGDVTTRLSLRIVAGVSVIELEHDRISRARTSRGYSLVATTPRIDVAAASFERQLDLCSTSRRPSSASAGSPGRSRERRGGSTRWSTSSCLASSASATRSRWCSPSASWRIASGSGAPGRLDAVAGPGRWSRER